MSDRHVRVTFRPLTHWPAGREKTPAPRREDAKFAAGRWQENVPGQPTQGSRFVKTRTPVETTYDELDRELYAIMAQDVVVQLDVRSERELRSSDGYPLSKAVMLSPAVVLTFVRNGNLQVPLAFACDWFKRWEDNLRAIVHGLEGLRRLERYHIAQGGDQYRGWQALPASTSTALSTEAAAQVLANRSGMGAATILRDVRAAQLAYRAAAAAAHPDRATGTTSDFQLVQEAKRVLETHLSARL